jgi:hypothetical protein
MLPENRFTRYVLYALGEIVLVVIGILIALEVGVINDNMDRQELEKKVLLEIFNNLEGDLVDIESEQGNFKLGMQKISMSIKHLRQKLPFHDSIGAAIEAAELSPHLSIKLSGYKMLEAKGIDLISDDSLRIRISALYEIYYPYYATYAGERFNALETQVQPYLTRNFFLEPYPEWPYYKRIPHNYAELLKDPQFISILQISYFHADIMAAQAAELKHEVRELQGRIKTHLHR